MGRRTPRFQFMNPSNLYEYVCIYIYIILCMYIVYIIIKIYMQIFTQIKNNHTHEPYHAKALVRCRWLQSCVTAFGALDGKRTVFCLL